VGHDGGPAGAGRAVVQVVGSFVATGQPYRDPHVLVEARGAFAEPDHGRISGEAVVVAEVDAVLVVLVVLVEQAGGAHHGQVRALLGGRAQTLAAARYCS
jgi:hypothetical protein